jgi:4-hydroxy-tetrahydrodipicolinate synthase
MTKKLMFPGIHVPLVTPFLKNKIDKRSLRRLINLYIKEGATGLVPCGTTGEAPTLSHEEHEEVIRITVEEANGRVPVIAGTGSNETAKAIEFTKYAERVGADGALVVGPYYNRPTQAGLYEHYRAIAKRTRLPIIIYNIPIRTGRNIETDTVIKLSKIPNIVGIKEASADINQVMNIIKGTESFTVLSGEDHLIFPLCCLGGHGAIVASAHLATSEFVDLWKLVEERKIGEARALHYRLLPLIRAFFSEANPSPIKAALAMLDMISSDEVRLPLVPATPNCRQSMKAEMKNLGLM